MEEFHHLSQIRIGNRIVYNGVNGDAFSFGEQPAACAESPSNSSRQDDVASSKLSSRASSPGERATSVKHVSDILATNTAHILAASVSSISAKADDGRHVDKVQWTPLTYEENLCMQLKTSLERQSSAHAPVPMSPAAVGLPAFLPPPPSAHIPPPLPSRPPSAAPSRSSSLSSLFSLRHDDRSRGTPTPPEIEERAHDECSAAHNHVPSFIFRSSGTIKVQAPSRDLPHSSQQHQLSPPPLPLPAPDASSLELPSPSSSSFSSRNNEAPPSAGRSHASSHSLQESTIAKLVTLPASPSALSLKSNSSTSSRCVPDEEDTDLEGHVTEVQGQTYTRSLTSQTQGPVTGQNDDQLQLKNNANGGCDVDRNIILSQLTSFRKRPMNYADIISSAFMFYKFTTAGKKTTPAQTRVEKAAQCRKCGRQFGFRNFRYRCARCRKTFCDACIPVMRVETEEQDGTASSLTRVCGQCSDEIACESSHGAYRGLWSEFQTVRKEARASRGLDVTSSNTHRALESQTMLDVTLGLRSLCLRFLITVHQSEKQARNNFLVNYLHFENSTQNRLKGKVYKNKECSACRRQLRMLTELRECDLCEQVFCSNCVYPTLQLFLSPGTHLKEDIDLEAIKFHVKADEQDDIHPTEACETYRVCAECEDDITRNLRIYEFNQKIPELEAEMFDLQRQLDHALTYGPYVQGLQRSMSAQNIHRSVEHDCMAANIKLANRLHDRYMRDYDILNNLLPQTCGQKMLHKHIKQAMYDFYIKRRKQLRSTLRRRDSWTNAVPDSLQ